MTWPSSKGRRKLGSIIPTSGAALFLEILAYSKVGVREGVDNSTLESPEELKKEKLELKIIERGSPE